MWWLLWLVAAVVLGAAEFVTLTLFLGLLAGASLVAAGELADAERACLAHPRAMGGAPRDPRPALRPAPVSYTPLTLPPNREG